MAVRRFRKRPGKKAASRETAFFRASTGTVRARCYFFLFAVRVRMAGRTSPAMPNTSRASQSAGCAVSPVFGTSCTVNLAETSILSVMGKTYEEYPLDLSELHTA